MRRTNAARAVVAVLAALTWSVAVWAQRQGFQLEPATLTCPSLLGEGATSGRTFCDVLIGVDPAAGVLVPIPPHRGDVTLRFDLHNRHLYSEDEIANKRAYRRYTATVGVLTADNTLLARAVIESEFRTAADLLDRVLGGGGPGGLKAVAPTGLEAIVLTIPEEEDSVSILGEHLEVIGSESRRDRFVTPGRPAAVVSAVTLEYRPRRR